MKLIWDLAEAVNRQVEALKSNSPDDLLAATGEAEEILRTLFQVGLEEPVPTPELKEAVAALREARERLRLLLARAVALDLETVRMWQRLGVKALDCSV
ncbi:hypothetical protein Adeg_0246 [Ammonifex degensii KC4]|uniref:Flagellar protein FliT n=1 Tax=Ammonifex degensii (strain DSM 10501 / KC4) TaxID=429009 RepID=C9RAY8_AMMDK|nr:hypothetical protein Adeg_0246 [Ammonifex degensii KC4]